MLGTSNWKEFRIEDLFDIRKGKRLTKQDMTEGDTLFIGSTALNNGKTATIGQAPIFEGNCITVSYNGSVGEAFYQTEPFWASDDINVLYLKDRNLNECLAMFLCCVLRKAGKAFGYSQKWNLARMAESNIKLPTLSCGEPDWDFMEQYIAELEEERVAELEEERVAELEAYLVSAGLDDYELTEEDKEVLSLSEKSASYEDGYSEDFDGIWWKEFRIGDLFEASSPKKRFNANAVKFDGEYPYVARGSSNNGIRGYITEDTKYLSPANSLSFGQDTATIYYQPKPYFTGDKIKVMVLRNYKLTETLATYFITAISKAFSGFSWGQNSFNENVIKNTLIKLPVLSNGTPDFEYMEKYIRAIEKLTIKGVVEWKDREISEIKKII